MGKILLNRLNIMRLRGAPAVRYAALRRSRCACAFGPRYSLKTSTFLGVFAFVRILDFRRMSTSASGSNGPADCLSAMGNRRKTISCV
jgi:hypothetical protein